ncbi:MAG: YraN family protein [Nitrospirota bacterium]|nr:MAG: YraN family protein [Nitrospirota bacterium]
MKSDGQRFGEAAEILAQQWLRKKGYRILERNIRLPGGELDMIVRHGDMLVFVEVKARRTDKYGGAPYAIHRSKEQRMIKLAAQYMAQLSPETFHAGPCRFDVILCQQKLNGPIEIQHIENAFEVSGEDLRW